jgi:hypothetical protein
VTTNDPNVISGLAASLAATAETLGETRARPVGRYWKIPEWHEITVEVRPGGEGSAVYERLLAELGDGWQRGGSSDEPWAVWNPSPQGRCFSGLVTWMSLDMSWE